MTAYSDLEEKYRRLAILGDATAMLHWDMAVMMPPGGAETRAEQLATLRVICHDLLADPALADLLDEAESDTAGLDDWQTANLREMRRQWIHANALDARLVEAFSKICSTTDMVWRKARPDSDFAAVRPNLEEMLDLVREIAARKAAALGTTPYDALLDEFEPGGRAAEIDHVFDDLAGFLPDFIDRVIDHQAAAGPAAPFAADIPEDRQRALGHRIMEVLGFDFDHGRLDTSAHPFSSGAPDDLRITTRYSAADFTESLMGVIHETGHALYEHQLPADWRHQPVGQSRGMALHESQSLLMEMQACRSPEFIRFAAPLMREVLGGKGPAWSEDNIERHYRRVARSFIRVEADEVTYPAHVILRYRLERAMIAGDLAIADLPGAWNEAMTEMLGITPPDDRRGCLQDLHWYDGAWGYFPTYTLGAMIAAQLYAAADEADSDIRAGIGRGDFKPLLAWLKANVHGHGSRLSTTEVVTAATGRPLDPACFERHLAVRYLDGA
jgi:carboxypeptidase Taq